MLADTKCCGQTPQTRGQAAGVRHVPAVKENQIIAADDDVASRWGPRVADFAEPVAKALRGRAERWST